MKASKFKTYANSHCLASKLKPDQSIIDAAIKAAKKRPLKGNAIVIARHNWIIKHRLLLPSDIELANFCLIVKGGKEHLAFYSNTLTHVIKKQRYHIQVIN